MEDAIAINECFPASLAWGQAASQEGRDVSDPDTTSTQSTVVEAKTAAMADIPAMGTNQGKDHIISRLVRIYQANRKFVGPDQVNLTKTRRVPFATATKGGKGSK